MPFPFQTQRRPRPKPGRKAQHRVSLTLRVSAHDNSLGDRENVDDSYFHDRWHLLSPDFDELPDDPRELL